jgi:hypothetical protein
MSIRFRGQKDASLRRQVEGGESVWFDKVDRIYTFKAYRKTSLAYAVKMGEDFEVETNEGVMAGKAGDYLAVGAAGEMYPIDAEVFEATYEEADERQPEA